MRFVELPILLPDIEEMDELAFQMDNKMAEIEKEKERCENLGIPYEGGENNSSIEIKIKLHTENIMLNVNHIVFYKIQEGSILINIGDEDLICPLTLEEFLNKINE
jgi:hypothetical protein